MKNNSFNGYFAFLGAGLATYASNQIDDIKKERFQWIDFIRAIDGYVFNLDIDIYSTNRHFIDEVCAHLKGKYKILLAEKESTL